MKPLNNLLVSMGSPGMFHCGVELLGVEYCFIMMRQDRTKSLVWNHAPKSHPCHMYRESVWMGHVESAAAEVEAVIACLKTEWASRRYHYCSCNCIDFAQELTLRLCCPNDFPAWAHGIVKVPMVMQLATQIDSPYMPASSVGSIDVPVSSVCESAIEAPTREQSNDTSVSCIQQLSVTEDQFSWDAEPTILEEEPLVCDLAQFSSTRLGPKQTAHLLTEQQYASI